MKTVQEPEWCFFPHMLSTTEFYQMFLLFCVSFRATCLLFLRSLSPSSVIRLIFLFLGCLNISCMGNKQVEVAVETHFKVAT